MFIYTDIYKTRRNLWCFGHFSENMNDNTETFLSFMVSESNNKNNKNNKNKNLIMSYLLSNNCVCPFCIVMITENTHVTPVKSLHTLKVLAW